MKRIDPFIQKQVENENNDDDLETSEEESGPEKEANKEGGESYEKQREDRMKANDEKLRELVQPVRRSLRNAMVTADIGSKEVQLNQHGENVESNNMEGYSRVGGDLARRSNKQR